MRKKSVIQTKYFFKIKIEYAFEYDVIKLRHNDVTNYVINNF